VVLLWIMLGTMATGQLLGAPRSQTKNAVTHLCIQKWPEASEEDEAAFFSLLGNSQAINSDRLYF